MFAVMHKLFRAGTAGLGYDIVTADTSCAVLNLRRETADVLCVLVPLLVNTTLIFMIVWATVMLAITAAIH